MSSWGAALMNAGSNLGSTFYTTAWNKRESQRQRDWNEAMWHKSNEYNSPAAQMERFREAGLNPNMIYGQGNPGNAGQVPSYERASMQTPNIDLLGSYMGYKKMGVEISNMEADTQLKERDQTIKFLQAIGLEVDNEQQALNLLKSLELYDTDVEKEKLQLVLLGIQQTLGNKQITHQQILNERETINMMYLEFEKTLNLTKTYEEIKSTQLANRMTEEEWKYYKRTGMLLGNKPLYQLFANLISGQSNASSKISNAVKIATGQAATKKGTIQMPKGTRTIRHPNSTRWQ